MERKLTPSFESMQVKEVVEANTVVQQSLSRTTLAVDGLLLKHFSTVVTSQGESARIVALWRPCGRCGDGANRITTSQERRDACFHHIITSEEASDDTTSKNHSIDRSSWKPRNGCAEKDITSSHRTRERILRASHNHLADALSCQHHHIIVANRNSMPHRWTLESHHACGEVEWGVRAI